MSESMQLPLPASTTYDQMARYLLVRRNPGLLHWLLGVTAEQVRFDGWVQTQLTLPGVAERICDGIARLADLSRGGTPFVGILEIQTRPDFTMPGRMMLAGGLCQLLLKPTNLPGDRFELVGLVVNLTGKGDSARCSVLGTAEWTLRPREWNVETLDAAGTLEEIERGMVPREILALVPLMRYTDEDAIIQRWLSIAGTDTNLVLRGDYSLAQVFAQAVGRGPAWRKALEGFQMIEPELVTEWKSKAKQAGKLEVRVEWLLRVVKRSYGQVQIPEEVASAIRACDDPDSLDRWLDTALACDTLEQFRQQTGL